MVTGHISREPVAYTAALTAVLDCAILFGLHLSDKQEAGIIVAVTAVMAIFTRGKVTPAATADTAEHIL